MNVLKATPSLPQFDDFVRRYFETKQTHPQLDAIVGEWDEALIHQGLHLRDKLVHWLGGVPRLEKAIAPVNAESNDLYQFRMASVFYETAPEKRGSYIMYYRRPNDMGGAVLAGVEHALDTLEKFKLDPRFLHKLLSENKITPGLYQALLSLDSLDIEVDAIPEGTMIGPNTPVLTVSGPLWQVQLAETILLQCIDYATGVASRAAAIVEASGGKPLVDFGARRAPGEQAAIISSLSSVKGGASAVANTLTSYLSTQGANTDADYIADLGTTAHAFTEAYLRFDPEGNLLEDPALSEEAAYTDWIKYFPESTCVLIDTIDKKVGLRTTATIYEKLGLRERGEKIGVRDDSAITPQSILFIHDELRGLGVNDFFIVISDSMTPNKVRALREGVVAERGQAFWDELDIRFGVGTYIARPEPMGFVFKLAEYEEDGQTVPVSKRSGTPEKASFQVVSPHRLTNSDGELVEDINLHPEESAQSLIDGTRYQIRALAKRAMKKGKRLKPAQSAQAIAQHWKGEQASLPKNLFGRPYTTHRPRFSERIRKTRDRIQEHLANAA
jgi:nicotinate phosphoribosyltransferase